MADSKVEIWNLALGHVHDGKSVKSVTEKSFEADQCRLFYDISLNAALRAHNWNFAKKRLVLAQVGTAPSGWEFQYAYPSDCIKAVRIHNIADPKNDKLPPLKFDVAQNTGGAGKVIWTDVDKAELVYTSFISDTTLFDSQFDMIISYYLASKIAMPITADRNRVNDMIALYRFELGIGKAADANENHEQKDNNPSWLTARI